MVAHSSSYQASLPTATWQIQYFPVRDCKNEPVGDPCSTTHFLHQSIYAEKMNPQCHYMAHADAYSVLFPSPGLSNDHQEALWGCAEELAKTQKRNHFLLLVAPYLPELLLIFLHSFCFSLSLGISLKNAFHSVFHPDMLNRSKAPKTHYLHAYKDIDFLNYLVQNHTLEKLNTVWFQA